MIADAGFFSLRPSGGSSTAGQFIDGNLILRNPVISEITVAVSPNDLYSTVDGDFTYNMDSHGNLTKSGSLGTIYTVFIASFPQGVVVGESTGFVYVVLDGTFYKINANTGSVHSSLTLFGGFMTNRSNSCMNDSVFVYQNNQSEIVRVVSLSTMQEIRTISVTNTIRHIALDKGKQFYLFTQGLQIKVLNVNGTELRTFNARANILEYHGYGRNGEMFFRSQDGDYMISPHSPLTSVSLNFSYHAPRQKQLIFFTRGTPLVYFQKRL